MRYITLAIAILIGISAEAQVIRAEPFYTAPEAAAAPSGDLLLDSFPGAAVAYSLRKLDKDYTGSAIRVRRSSDNTEQDIGFVNNYLDTASMKTFVGANNGFVVTWYNQADSAGVFGVINATQSNAANQPRIINAGAIEVTNSKPSVRFVTSSLNLPKAVLGITHSAFIAYRNQGTTTGAIIGQWASGQTGRYQINTNQDCGGVQTTNRFNYFNSTTTQGGCLAGGGPGLLKDIAISSTALNLMNILQRTGSNEVKSYYNNVFDDDATITAIYTGASTAIGANNATLSPNLAAFISEIIIYNSYESTNLGAINGNINSFYSIY